ncbi:hypothetical protein PI126_g18833 [Phytophthora idaei]|nr:hypothetical protein PI126_g18833 [Phytophthora idaei]
MSSSLTQATPMRLQEQEGDEELSAWKRETRYYLLKDVHSVVDYAAQELERIDFIWGRIRSDRGAASPAIKADIRIEGHLVVFTKVELKLTKAQRNAPINSTLQQYCVLNQILEFHGIVQSQVGRLAALKEFLHVQRQDLLNDQPKNDDVEVYVDIVQRTFQSLGRICQELRNAANVLRLPSRRRFPYCSHVDHGFKPALPPEVIVDFSIHRGELLVEAFSLMPTQKSITNIPEGCASRKEFIGCVCAFRGQKVEIVEYARVSMPIPQLEEMLVHLDEQIAWLCCVSRVEKFSLQTRRHSISMNQSASSANLTPSASMEVPLAVAVAFTGEQESSPALNDEVPDSSLRIAGVNEFPGSSEGTVAETPTTAKLENATDAVLPRTVAANSEPAAATQAKSRPPSDPPTVTTNSEPLAARKVESGPPSDPPALVVVKPMITPTRAFSVDKQLTGMKPIVPLRKRGQSFRETKKMITTVDSDGRRHLNQYTFMEQLGKGAYGIVFKVECNETKETFAAKCVDKKALKRIRVGRFGNALQSVKKELNIWKRFKHRHIVVLREVIDTDDSDELYMISELVEGGPVLDDDIKCTPLNAELTKTYFTHLIEGIDFLHENKIIHRDIKPGNLLLKTVDDNEVILKIADFGVSHEMEHDNEDMRQTAGTAIFMAPEMLTGESFQGKPVDIWACGITLYMFVYGQPPFIAQTMTVLYGKIQSDPIEYPTQVGDRVVESELIDLMQHLLEKDPKQRFTSQQIRAHPWAWRECQVSAIKCVTHPEGRRTSFSAIPKSLAGVASIRKSMRSLFSRPSAVFPGGSSRASLPTVMTNFRAPQ